MASKAIMSEELLLETMWSNVYAQYFGGNVSPILPDSVPSSVLAAIVARLGVLMPFPALAVPVPSLGIIRLVSTADTVSPTMSSDVASPASVVGSAESKGKAKIPRPPNAFILYRKHHHEAIKAEHPGIVNNEISKIVADMWKAEDAGVKATWKAKADAAKEEHLKKHPGYSYQPRKPSEKKRRMTKRKAALLRDLPNGMATGNKNQIAAPQLPMPSFSFSFSPADPMQMEFILGNGVSLSTFGQTIDQYNNSQLLSSDSEPPSVVSSTNFANVTGDYSFVGTMNPAELIDHPITGFATGDATNGGDFFVDDTVFEQERQELLSSEVEFWGF